MQGIVDVEVTIAAKVVSAFRTPTNNGSVPFIRSLHYSNYARGGRTDLYRPVGLTPSAWEATPMLIPISESWNNQHTTMLNPRNSVSESKGR
jgi:hypothetical protein